MSIRFAVMAPVLIALTASAARGQAAPAKRQAVVDLRLDAASEDFPDISNVFVSPKGQIAVLVGGDQQIRFYDASGKRTATFGRKGSGPGEFQRASRGGWIADTLWVYDFDLRRVTYISPASKLIRSEVLSGNLNAFVSPGGGGRPGSSESGAILVFSPSAIAAGRYVGSAMVSTGRGADGRTGSISKIMALLPAAATARQAGRSATLTSAPDTVAANGERVFMAEAPPTLSSSVYYSPDGKSGSSSTIPFTFYPQTQFSPDGSRFAFLTVTPSATGGVYTLTVMSTKGDSIFKRSYPYAGEPIPSTVMDSAINNIGIGPDGKQFFPPGNVPHLQDLVRERAPKFYSPVSNMVLGRDGVAWIQTRRTTKGTSAILIDAKGNQVAIVDLPPRTRIVQATRDALWTIQTDEDDLPSVVRFRVR